MHCRKSNHDEKETAATPQKMQWKGTGKLLAILLAAAVIFSFCTGMSRTKEQTRYFEAVTAMDNGEYMQAAEIFEELNGYKDSKTLAKECYYIYAGELFDAGKIKSASVIYQELSGYKEADKYVEKCANAEIYQEAKTEYDRGDYQSAYRKLETMTQSDTDSRKLRASSVYRIAKQYYEEKNYKVAYDWYLILEECKDDLPKKTDLAFTNKIQLRYAESLIDTKKDTSINQALKILKAMKSTNDTKKLITKAEKQLKQNQYDIAAKYLADGKYESAANAFEKIKNFSDAKKQWLAAMYGYVQENKTYYEKQKSTDVRLSILKRGIEKFYSYAKTLSQNNYKDSKEYYKNLTAWKVDIVMNGDVDSVTAATCVSKYDDICAHLKLTGGPLDGETKIRYEFTFPDGGKTSGTFKEKWEHGDTGTCWCYYNDPSKGKKGKCTVKIFDGNNTLIGKSQIEIVG